MLGERQHRFSKYCLYDSSVRVPMILAGSYLPQGVQGSVDDRPAELVDLVPTLSKVAGLPGNPQLPGLDLLGETQRLGTFCEFHGKGAEPHHSAPALMWRKQDYKLILYMPGKLGEAIGRIDEFQGELYDLAADPNEWHNRYADENYARIRERMTGSF